MGGVPDRCGLPDGGDVCREAAFISFIRFCSYWLLPLTSALITRLPATKRPTRRGRNPYMVVVHSRYWSISGPLIVLGEVRSEFAKICCGVSGPKFCVSDHLVSGKVILHQLQPLWCPDTHQEVQNIKSVYRNFCR
jgi:hypothetical protein